MRLTDSEIKRIGAGIALAVPTWPRWIHRTVDCVAFQDDLETRHAITKYFTVPERDWLPSPYPESESCYLPIARLRKGLALNFDVAEASGARVAVVPAAMAAEMCLATFDALSEAAAGQAMPGSVKDEVRRVLGRDRGDARAALERLDGTALPSPLRETTVFWQFADLLADDRLIIVELSATPGQTRVVSFSFDLPSRLLLPLGLVPRRHRASRAVALEAKEMVLPLPDVGDAGSYHLEAEAPPGLQFQERRLHLYVPDVEPVDVDARPSSTRRAVFDIPPQSKGTEGLSSISVRPEAGALVIGGAMAALLTAALLAWIGIRAPHINADAAATLLVLVPGLLTLFISRPGEHPLTTRALLGLRIAALLPLTVSIIGAAVFIGDLPENLTQRILFGLAGLSAVTGIVISVAWRRSRSKPRPAPPSAQEDILVA